MASEKAFKDALCVELSRLPGVRCWVQNSGLAFGPHGGRVKVLPDGAADVGGIARLDGRGVVLQVECKTARGAVRASQKAWRAMIEAHGGVYVLATLGAGESARDGAARWAREVRVTLEARGRLG